MQVREPDIQVINTIEWEMGRNRGWCKVERLHTEIGGSP